MAEEERPDFSGKWQVYLNENFEDFMRENGANWMVRKMAGNSKSTIEITQDGEKFKLELLSMFKSREEEFTVGEEYEQTQHDGSISKAKAHWEGQKLIVSYEPKDASSGHKSSTAIRELVEGELHMTLKVGDVTARRLMKKIP